MLGKSGTRLERVKETRVLSSKEDRRELRRKARQGHDMDSRGKEKLDSNTSRT